MSRPRVVVFGQASLDGRITLGRDVLLLPWGDSAEAAERWSELNGGSRAVQERLEALHSPGAYLEGSESFVKSSAFAAAVPAFQGDPSPLYDDFLPDEVVSKPERRAWMLVPDSRGRVRWSLKFVDGVHVLVLVATSTPPAYLAWLRSEGIPYLVRGGERVDLAAALAGARDALGVETLLCTSPGKLGGLLLQLGMVDEVDVEVLPAIVGGAETPSLFSSFQSQALKAARLDLLSAETVEGGRVWLRYSVRHE
jgi:riboflavin biosynthesis pyrimidine reductase